MADEKLKVGFDLDGTLDRPGIHWLCNALLEAEHEVHVITGQGGEWQNDEEKRNKLARLGYRVPLHIIKLDPTVPLGDRYDREVHVGHRKGDLCEKLGLDIFFEDSATHADAIRKVCGRVQVVLVGTGD